MVCHWDTIARLLTPFVKLLLVSLPVLQFRGDETIIHRVSLLFSHQSDSLMIVRIGKGRRDLRAREIWFPCSYYGKNLMIENLPTSRLLFLLSV